LLRFVSIGACAAPGSFARIVAPATAGGQRQIDEIGQWPDFVTPDKPRSGAIRGPEVT
jgi:hypothetical protein